MAELAGGPTAIELPIGEASQVGEARRAAVQLGEQVGLGETERGHLALVATEAATNLVRHARGGVLLLRALAADAGAASDTPPDGVELLAVDRGPGMGDLPRHLRDGFSTAGTAGHGLGAMRRLADELDVHSVPDVGTTLVARVWTAAGRQRRQQAVDETGVVCRPIAGETACGDAWAVARHGGGTVVMVADGLGHGPDAAAAADAAVAVFRRRSQEAPAAILAHCHGALRATRGAAVAVAAVDWTARTVRFAGVGNIAASLVVPEHGGERGRSFASMNGIVGQQMRTVNEYVQPWPAGACLVLHSDGLATRWRLDAYPGLVARHPALVAGVLWRDFTRGRDDVTVLVARESRGLGTRV
ncbi:MAG TPA: ATP-binding protein [Gemmatimonadaceae bacterium]